MVITVVFTRNRWSPLSWLIRWAIPRSRFALALSSHCMILDGNYFLHATIFGGVKKVNIGNGLVAHEVVRRIDYEVPDSEAGLVWANMQVGKPYDWRGAFGLFLDPFRDWSAPDSWFCYEYAAAAIKYAGRDVFANTGHIGEPALLAIRPGL